MARLMPGFFDLLIADEMHEYKGRGSAQGIAAGNLAGACGKVLTLTGTLMGGYASTLFYLLWRFSPAVREEFGYGDEQRWITRLRRRRANNQDGRRRRLRGRAHD